MTQEHLDSTILTHAAPTPGEAPSSRSLGEAISGAVAPLDWLSADERHMLIVELHHHLQQRELSPLQRGMREAQQSCIRWLPSSSLITLEQRSAQLVAASLLHVFNTVDLADERRDAWREGTVALRNAFQSLERVARAILSTRYQKGNAGLATAANIYGVQEHELVALHAASLTVLHRAL